MAELWATTPLAGMGATTCESLQVVFAAGFFLFCWWLECQEQPCFRVDAADHQIISFRCLFFEFVQLLSRVFGHVVQHDQGTTAGTIGTVSPWEESELAILMSACSL